MPRSTTTKLDMFASVEEAIAEAQRICASDPSSPECRVAWDIVEELEAADSHQGAAAGAAAGAQSTTDYAALMGSFDILSQKIAGKMDQLQATTDKLVELGVTDPSVAELGARAEEMKQQLARASATLKQY